MALVHVVALSLYLSRRLNFPGVLETLLEHTEFLKQSNINNRVDTGNYTKIKNGVAASLPVTWCVRPNGSFSLSSASSLYYKIGI